MLQIFLQGFAVYFIVWWLTLFAVLPIGLRTQAEDNEVVLGTVPSAPARFRNRCHSFALEAGPASASWMGKGPLRGGPMTRWRGEQARCRNSVHFWAN